MTSPVIAPASPQWPEAEIIAEPLRSKELAEPVVLVRRRKPIIVGPRNEELIVLPGAPAISLFTGAGGMDLGIEQAGFCCVCQHEWDDTACQALIVNRPRAFRHAALIQGDIRRTPTSMLLSEAGLRVGEPYLLVGGPPCQGFSTSGKRQVDDVRNTLVFEYIRVLREAQPKFFLMENVPGFVSLAKGQFMRDFLTLAHGAFYELVYGIVNAVEYGVPQIRNRFICMGTRRDLVECDGMLASLPAPTHFGREDLGLLKDLAGRPLFRSDGECIRHAPGIRYFPDRPVLVPPAPCFSGERTKSFKEFYKHLRETEPDRLVDAPGEERNLISA